MSKQWELKRAEVKVIGGYFGKLSCPAKFNEFYRQIDFVRSPFPNSEVVKTLTRKIVEEVTNIVEHNRSWNTIRVRTKLNSSETRFKAEISYDGGEYYDPETNDIRNVIGSISRFKDYKRSVTIDTTPSLMVTIKINIEP